MYVKHSCIVYIIVVEITQAANVCSTVSIANVSMHRWAGFEQWVFKDR